MSILQYNLSIRSLISRSTTDSGMLRFFLPFVFFSRYRHRLKILAVSSPTLRCLVNQRLDVSATWFVSELVCQRDVCFPSPCICRRKMSFRPSVCPSHCGILSKPLHISSEIFRRRIHRPTTSFSARKGMARFRW